MTDVDLEKFRVPRPRRADGARNFDAIVAAAREAFLADGADVALELVAERAGVGIATLYRNFPTREVLLEHLYVEEIQSIVGDAASVEELAPWEAMTVWVRRFVEHLGRKRKLGVAISPDGEVFAACSEAILGTAAPIVDRVRASGDLRRDVTDADLLRAVYGIATMEIDSEAQRQKILEVFLNGLGPVGKSGT
ncbi:helix-turn-helix domain-containing protein [Amycolatopsis ultiminotia]|uniref:TetR/AcrR family transcriptional regulator n=1 Tax=Amycolatopsis ultiminotia TaxID=543629 RepID=UPI0031EA06AD